MCETTVNRWTSPAHAAEYLARADAIPHRAEGEAALIEWLPRQSTRVLDLGSGDGRLLRVVKDARPNASAVALDFSETMLGRLHTRFAADPSVGVLAHDLDQPLPRVVGQVRRDRLQLRDSTIFPMSESERSTTRRTGFFGPAAHSCQSRARRIADDELHERFLDCLCIDPAEEDPSNELLDVETQLAWLRAIGFANVDCHWKWRELALLAAESRTGE